MEHKLPTVEEIMSFLDTYGWKYKTASPEGKEIVLTPYALLSKNKGILISLGVEGEFVIATTVGLLGKVPSKYSKRLLVLNDVIKLVKLYTIDEDSKKRLTVELGFELWQESWNEETFFAFMDMFTIEIEKVLDIFTQEKIPHETNFIAFK